MGVLQPSQLTLASSCFLSWIRLCLNVDPVPPAALQVLTFCSGTMSGGRVCCCQQTSAVSVLTLLRPQLLWLCWLPPVASRAGAFTPPCHSKVSLSLFQLAVTFKLKTQNSSMCSLRGRDSVGGPVAQTHAPNVGSWGKRSQHLCSKVLYN